MKKVQPGLQSLWKQTNESRRPEKQTAIHHSVMLSIHKNHNLTSYFREAAEGFSTLPPTESTQLINGKAFL